MTFISSRLLGYLLVVSLVLHNELKQRIKDQFVFLIRIALRIRNLRHSKCYKHITMMYFKNRKKNPRYDKNKIDIFMDQRGV